MPTHNPTRFARRQARISARQDQAGGRSATRSGGSAMRTRIGRPPGMPEVCRRYLARQAVGLLPTESIDED
jgi:hypothetical protein